MRSFRFMIFYILAITLIGGCQTKLKHKKLKQLVALVSTTSQREFCTTLSNENDSATSTQIKSLLSDMGYNCCRIYCNTKGELEDSILVLTKRSLLQVQTIYYDFAKRDRELKTWNYPNAADKRVKLE